MLNPDWEVVSVLFVMLVYMVMVGIGITSYVLNSYTIYNLAKRRNISKPWMAWIPVAGSWTVGCLANEYDLKSGHDRKWQKVLIILGIIFYATLILAVVSFVFWVIAMSTVYGSYSLDMEFALAGGLLLFYAFYIVAILAATAWGMCETLCIYKIFESTVPEKALKYIILYILVPLAGPICLYKVCEKGYPNPEAVTEE